METAIQTSATTLLFVVLTVSWGTVCASDGDPRFGSHLV
jgi:hypothetical protein